MPLYTHLGGANLGVELMVPGYVPHSLPCWFPEALSAVLPPSQQIQILAAICDCQILRCLSILFYFKLGPSFLLLVWLCHVSPLIIFYNFSVFVDFSCHTFWKFKKKTTFKKCYTKFKTNLKGKTWAVPQRTESCFRTVRTVCTCFTVLCFTVLHCVSESELAASHHL